LNGEKMMQVYLYLVSEVFKLATLKSEAFGTSLSSYFQLSNTLNLSEIIWSNAWHKFTKASIPENSKGQFMNSSKCGRKKSFMISKTTDL
jgi:hypothetical protein